MKKNLLIIMAIFQIGYVNAQVNLNSGLLACYPFNGNANDQSGNGHNGILNGPVLTADRFSNPNSAYYFGGTNDYIDLGLFSDFTTSNEFSISAWIQPLQVNLQTILMVMPDDFNDRFNATAYYSHNGNSATIWDFGDCSFGGRLIQLGTVFSSAWQHWVYTVEPGIGMNVYKDGVLQISQTSTSSLVNRQRNLWIGGGSDAANAQFYFQGVIDDIRLYDRALNPSEVQALFSLQTLCSTTGISNLNSTNSPYSVVISNQKAIVTISKNAPSASFILTTIDGSLLFKRENIKAGEQFEIPLNNTASGILIYKFNSINGMTAGKLFSATSRNN